MARIPTYQSQTGPENVNLNAPKQQLNAPLAAFGSDGMGLQEAGKGLRGVGSALAVAAVKMREEQAASDANKGLTELVEKTTPYMTQVTNAKGGDAIGTAQGTKEHIQGVSAEISGKLSSSARAKFDTASENYYRSKYVESAQHEASQRQEYRYTAASSAALSLAQDALRVFNNAALFDSSLTLAAEKQQEALAVKGYGPESEQAKQALTVFQSKIVHERAQAYLNMGSVSEAQKIAANDMRLTSEDREALKKAIKPAAELGQAQALMDSTKGMGLDARLSLAQKKAEAGELEPQARAKFEDLAKGDYHLSISRSHEADYQYSKSLQDNIVKAFQRGDIAAVDKLSLNAGRGQAVHAAELALKLKAGALVATDPATDWQLTQMVANDPQAFRANWNPLLFGNKLSKADLQKYDNLYVGIGKGDNKVVDDIRTDAGRIAEAAMALGIKNIENASEDEQARLGQFSRTFQMEVDEHITRAGKKPSPAEKDAIVDRLLLRGRVKGSGFLWDNEARVFERVPNTSIEEPKRPASLAPGAKWDSKALGWRVGDKLLPYKQVY